LCDGARKIEQVHLPRIHERQKVAIEVGLRFLRQLILDTQLPELLTGPFARVPVACYCVDAIVFQKARKLCDDAFGENGGLTSRTASSTAVVSWRWPIARVKLSEVPPDGSVKAK